MMKFIIAAVLGAGALLALTYGTMVVLGPFAGGMPPLPMWLVAGLAGIGSLFGLFVAYDYE